MKSLMAKSLICLLVAAQIGHAATVSNTLINVVMIDRGHGAKVFVKTGTTKTGNPTCHTSSGWAFVFPLENDTDKAMYSALLAAKNAGSKVTLTGTATCAVYSSIETLNRIEVL